MMMKVSLERLHADREFQVLLQDHSLVGETA